MIHRLLKFIVSFSPATRRKTFVWWYRLMAKWYCRKGLLFFNFGYASLDKEADSISLQENDEPYRYQIQLYEHTISTIDLTGKDVLEVGSGLGGGSSYVARYLQPKSMTAIDISSHAIDFCRESINIPNLSYHKGDAENISFPNESFDAVINVESSHSYQSMDKFLLEVARVLRINGYFMLCDIRDTKDMPHLIESINSSSLQLVKKECITDNIIEALDRMTEIKKDLIKKHLPSFFIQPVCDVLGVKDGKTYNAFKNGESSYISCIMQKIV